MYEAQSLADGRLVAFKIDIKSNFNNYYNNIVDEARILKTI